MVGELKLAHDYGISPCFSLVAEIGWLASYAYDRWTLTDLKSFQSRCRDWVVGETGEPTVPDPDLPVSVSLPRLGGWRAFTTLKVARGNPRFSLVAEIGWLASRG